MIVCQHHVLCKRSLCTLFDLKLACMHLVVYLQAIQGIDVFKCLFA